MQLDGAVRPIIDDPEVWACRGLLRLLKGGVFDTSSGLKIQDQARSYANWFCSLNFTESSQAVPSGRK